MLHIISWQQYGTAILLLTALWYAYVFWRYYRREKRESPPLVAYAPVIGGIKTDYEILDAEELSFGAATPDDISTGPTDELVSEAQTLAQAFRDTPNKTEFLSLLNVLLSKYEPYQDEIDLKALRPLAAQLPFTIEEQEWPKF
ncbi:MAG: hypothetical protein ABI308_09015 [Mucilaginibacter sp.]